MKRGGTERTAGLSPCVADHQRSGLRGIFMVKGGTERDRIGGEIISA